MVLFNNYSISVGFNSHYLANAVLNEYPANVVFDNEYAAMVEFSIIFSQGWIQ